MAFSSSSLRFRLLWPLPVFLILWVGCFRKPTTEDAGVDEDDLGRVPTSADVAQCYKLLDACDSCDYKAFRPYCSIGNAVFLNAAFECISPSCSKLSEPGSKNAECLESVINRGGSLGVAQSFGRVQFYCADNQAYQQQLTIMLYSIRQYDHLIAFDECTDTYQSCQGIASCIEGKDIGLDTSAGSCFQSQSGFTF